MSNEQAVALRCILICLDHGNRTAAYQIQEEFRISQQDVANMTLGEGRFDRNWNATIQTLANR